MKAIRIALLFTIAAALNAAERSEVFPTLGIERWLEVKTVLFQAKYPIRLPELLEKLGGTRSMRSNSSASSRMKDGKYRYFLEVAISDLKSEAGYYGIEFEVRDFRGDTPEVLAARVCFTSSFGDRFYLDKNG